jgi:iron-sulfur cluster assembly accessory protein
MSDKDISSKGITFTKEATDHLNEKIQEKKGAIGFRLSVRLAGCNGYRYHPEIITEIDQTDLHFSTPEGILVYIDVESVSKIEGCLIDFVKMGLGQKQLTFKNPNADSECGCGESFNLKNSETDGE